MNMTVPYPPSPVEAKLYYYGINSRPLLVARSSTDLWVQPPTGPHPSLPRKEITPVGWHPLNNVWETTVGPAMDYYLQAMGVKCTSLDPIRMGIPSNPSPPVIIWVGVLPGSLSANDGVHVALGCKSILTDNAIDDVHVEIRESVVTRSAKLYQPVSTSNPIVEAIEPFTTALGLPISTDVTPTIQGTAGLFFTDSLRSGKLYLLTARHVVFHPDNDSNELYDCRNASMPRRNVLLMGNEAMERCINAIESEIGGKEMNIDYIESILEGTKGMEEEEAEVQRKELEPQLEEQKTALDALKNLLVDIKTDWQQPTQRVLGHVVLSPPLAVNVGDEGYTEDWAVIEVDPSKVDSTNFNGNAIDIGVSPSSDRYAIWMYPNLADRIPFQYSHHRLLKFSGTISEDEMLKRDHDHDSCIMVTKRGCTSGLTVGRLNTIHSFVRVYINGHPGEMSKEVTVLPEYCKSDPFFKTDPFCESGFFSEPGDSGSAVIDGKGRVAGLLTGGTGPAGSSDYDCAYLTSINFLLKRLALHNVKANIFPTNIE